VSSHTIVVYHAPVESPGSYYGADVGLAAAQLSGKSCSYAGDYNILDRGERVKLWRLATKQKFNRSTFEGRRDDPDSPRSMVHAYVGGKWRSGDAILTNARDFGFGKGRTTGITVLAAAAQFAAGSKIRAYVSAKAPSIKALLGESFCKALPKAEATQVIDAFLDSTKAYPVGAGADATTARALLYNMLLSDHLPVQIDVGP
jgi:hypothetical protein